jgi:hypothetical protein
MEEQQSWKLNVLEMVLGITLVCVAMPFIALELTTNKVMAYIDLLKQMDSDL